MTIEGKGATPLYSTKTLTFGESSSIPPGRDPIRVSKVDPVGDFAAESITWLFGAFVYYVMEPPLGGFYEPVITYQTDTSELLV